MGHHGGQLQIVLGLHREADVGYLVAYHLVGSLLQVTAHDDVVPLIYLEVHVAVLGDAPAQPFAHVDDVHLRPEVYHAVGCRCAGQPNYAVYSRRGQSHGLEALTGVALERRQLVNHQHVERQLAVVPAHEPHEVVAACHVHVGLLCQGDVALLLRAQHLHNPQAFQVLPLLGLSSPCGFGHLLRRNHQHLRHLAVVNKLLGRSKGNNRLTQTEVYEQRTAGMREYPLHGFELILMRGEFHLFNVNIFSISSLLSAT